MAVLTQITLTLLLIFTFHSTSEAKEKRVNGRIGYPNAAIEYGFTKLSLGLAFSFRDQVQAIEQAEFLISKVRIGLRLTYYPGDFGKDGYYFSFDSGNEELTLKGLNPSTRESFEGRQKGNYVTSFFGYHWFWSVTNYAFGAGFFANTRSALDIVGSNGNPLFSPSATKIEPTLEFTIGSRF